MNMSHHWLILVYTVFFLASPHIEIIGLKVNKEQTTTHSGLKFRTLVMQTFK